MSEVLTHKEASQGRCGRNYAASETAGIAYLRKPEMETSLPYSISFFESHFHNVHAEARPPEH